MLLDGFYELLDRDYTFSRIAGLGINWDFKNIAVRKRTNKNKGSLQKLLQREASCRRLPRRL